MEIPTTPVPAEGNAALVAWYVVLASQERCKPNCIKNINTPKHITVVPAQQFHLQAKSPSLLHKVISQQMSSVLPQGISFIDVLFYQYFTPGVGISVVTR